MSKRINKKLHKVGMHIEPERKALDVVCGMEVDPAHTKLHVEHEGEEYYFCSENCKDHFKKDPEKYVG